MCAGGLMLRKRITNRANGAEKPKGFFTMRLEDLCEHGARTLQIDIMGAFLDVKLNMSCSDIRCHGEPGARDAKVLNSTKVSQSSRFGGELNGASRKKHPIRPSGIIF